MSGYRPQNRGNKSGRSGQAIHVSRQLREAGIMTRSNTDFGRKEGVFVKARGDSGVRVVVEVDHVSEAQRYMDAITEVLTGLGYNVAPGGEFSLMVTKAVPAE